MFSLLTILRNVVIHCFLRWATTHGRGHFARKNQRKQHVRGNKIVVTRVSEHLSGEERQWPWQYERKGENSLIAGGSGRNEHSHSRRSNGLLCPNLHNIIGRKATRKGRGGVKWWESPPVGIRERRAKIAEKIFVGAKLEFSLKFIEEMKRITSLNFFK